MMSEVLSVSSRIQKQNIHIHTKLIAWNYHKIDD